jgi:hypothetical protein
MAAVQFELTDDGEPPTEFRLFRPGLNPSRNGPALFDGDAAAKVMAAYEAHAKGPDGQGMRRPVMIDLEHLAVDGEAERQGVARVPDLDPLDARGWCALELRGDELWAVDVEWTDDGARRIREKRQRSISPAFWWETLPDGTERVIEIESLGLTAKPATDGPYGLNKAKGQTEMNLSEFLTKWHSLSPSQRAMPAGDKLLKLLAIDMKTLQKVVTAMGGDGAGDLTSLFATVRQFAEELAASVTGEPAPEPVNGEGGELMADNGAPDEEPAAAMARTDAAEQLAMLTARDAKLTKEVDKLRAANHARDEADKIHRFRLAVADSSCDLTAGKVWQDATVKPEDFKLEPWLARMSLAEIDAMIKKHGGSPGGLALSSVTPRPPARASAIVTAEEGIELDDFEVRFLRAKVDQVRSDADLPPANEHQHTVALEKYQDHRLQQLNYARAKRGELIARFGRKIGPDMVLSTVTGRVRRDAPKLLAVDAVVPYDEFGPSSQRAMEQFRLELLANLAALLEDWTARFGLQLTSGALKTSFPMHFQTTGYEEVRAQGAPASTPQSADIQVTLGNFSMAMSANLERMRLGDHAYIQSWGQQAAQMARGRVKKRRALLVTELEKNPKWAVTSDKPNGLDGQNFFTETALINPFDADLGTYSNLSTAGNPIAPLSAGADSLTLEQASWPEIPAWDGVDMEEIATELMVPTNLGWYARQLLDVKEVILREGLVADSGAGVGRQGPEDNEHKNSGVSWFTAAPLSKAGGLNANYYMLSQPIIAMGYPPWAMAEGDQDELREWGTDSDFYKDGPGDIKVASHIKLAVVLVHRQGIRRVNGS